MSRTETTFARLAAEIDAAMVIVTAYGDREPSGCLVGFHTQASIRPPRFLACISKLNRTHRVAWRAEVLVVHFVPEDAGDLAELFGAETGDEVDKFAHVDWHRGPGGAPVLSALDTWFAGRVLSRLDLGDHTGFLLAPIEGTAHGRREPFRFHRARRIAPGHPA